MAANSTSVTNTLKIVYKPDNCRDMIAKGNPLISLLKKDESFNGLYHRVAPKYGRPETISSSFAVGQASAAGSEASKYGAFDVNGITKYGFARASGDAIARTSNDVGAFVRVMADEIDGVIEGMGDRRERELFSSGWGDIGVIDAGSISGASLKFTTMTDLTNVHVGQQHVFAAAVNTGTLRNTGGTVSLTVAAVDPASRTITYTQNVSTVTGVQAGDTVFVLGDRQDAANPTRLCLTGLEGWVPSVDYSFAGESSNKFFNQDRSIHPTRLAGQRYDATGESIEDGLLSGLSILAVQGGKPDTVIVSPVQWTKLQKSLGSRVRYQDVSKANMGFKSLMMSGHSGDVNVISHRFCPENRAWALQLDSWKIMSNGPLVGLDDKLDGNNMLRVYNDDSVEARIVSRYAQLICNAPAFNMNIKLAV